MAAGGYVYHVLNRAVARATLFHQSGDYAAWEKVLREAHARLPLRVLAYCLMPNHWHLVLWPHHDGELSEFLRWLTVTHTQRWHAHYHSSGSGPLYQGRFKAFPVQADEHFLTVCRYVERNPLRAGLVGRAEQWRWSSLWHRSHGSAPAWLSAWPVPVPEGWSDCVQRPETAAELRALRQAVQRGCPFGEARWQERTVKELGLESSLRPRGRPRKVAAPAE